MPIYEFYCSQCHTIFNFLSRKINTKSIPQCPKCKSGLSRQVSIFAAQRDRGEAGPAEDLPMDESRLERAVESLAGEAEHLDENDPKQAARLMRRFGDMTGMKMGDGMQEVLGRLEAGEDPDQVEAELGDRLEGEEPFAPGEKRAGKRLPGAGPRRDPTLYDM